MLNRALRVIREVHQMQQGELANRLQISRSHLSDLETGRRTTISVDLLNRYAQVFDVPASTFLSFAEALEGESTKRKRNAEKLLSALDWLVDKQDVERSAQSARLQADSVSAISSSDDKSSR